MAEQELHPLACQLLRLPAVKARVGLGRSTLYAMIAEGKFPAPVPLGARAVAWSSDAIDQWVSERIAHGSRRGQA